MRMYQLFDSGGYYLFDSLENKSHLETVNCKVSSIQHIIAPQINHIVHCYSHFLPQITQLSLLVYDLRICEMHARWKATTLTPVASPTELTPMPKAASPIRTRIPPRAWCFPC